jgi:biopolymer transport protein TolR
MAGGATSKKGMIVGINVTPLVDITLVLLVVFIVTAKIVVTPAVPLDLPTASEGQEIQMVFSVLLPVDGSILVNGAVIAGVTELENRARQTLTSNETLRAVIQADGAVPHREVIKVLDTLKRAGVTRIAFGALPVESP